VSEAIRDEACLEWTEKWWSEASPHLQQPDEVVAAYRAKLLERFANPRMQDRLARIAEDGSQKLPIRVAPVLVAEREAGRRPEGAATIVAGWLCHLRGLGAPVRDVRADQIVPLAAGPGAVRAVLRLLHPSLEGDTALAGLVEDRFEMLTSRANQRPCGRAKQ
jgi:fructuronate reductase